MVASVVVPPPLLLFLWLVSILSLLPQIFAVCTSTRINAANNTSTTFISTAIMSIVIITTISITVAATITLTSIIVSIHIGMISTIVAIIARFMTTCTMKVTTITVSNNDSISIPAPVLLLSSLLLVRVPSSAQ